MMTTHAQPITPKQSSSSQDSSDISALTESARGKREAANNWNRIYLRVVAAVAVFTALAFVAQFFASNKSDEALNAQDELVRARDHAVALDLKAKDVEIQRAKAAASAADERAGKANEEAAKANERAGKLEVEAESLRADAERSRLAIAAAQSEAAQANARSAEAQLATEKLKAENVKLGMAVRPRVLGLWTSEEGRKEQQRLAPELEKFAGTKALIQSAAGEPERLALDIARVLERAKWDITSVEAVIPPYKTRLSDGVIISTREMSMFTAHGLVDPKQYKYSEVSEAARILVKFLLPDLGPPLGPLFWGVRWQPEQPNPNTDKYLVDIPEGVVLISVGRIPLDVILIPAPEPAKPK